MVQSFGALSFLHLARCLDPASTGASPAGSWASDTRKLSGVAAGLNCATWIPRPWRVPFGRCRTLARAVVSLDERCSNCMQTGPLRDAALAPLGWGACSNLRGRFGQNFESRAIPWRLQARHRGALLRRLQRCLTMMLVFICGKKGSCLF